MELPGVFRVFNDASGALRHKLAEIAASFCDFAPYFRQGVTHFGRILALFSSKTVFASGPRKKGFLASKELIGRVNFEEFLPFREKQLNEERYGILARMERF
jgi:hypothetical protein